MVGIVGAVGAVSVAFWNSRGESGELRQLKAMNEVVQKLDLAADEAIAFLDARDALLVRVAARTMTAPARRTTAGWIASLVVVVGIVILGTSLLYPHVNSDVARWLNVLVSTGVGALGAVAGISSIRKERHVEAGRLKHAAMLESLLVNSEKRE